MNTYSIYLIPLHYGKGEQQSTCLLTPGFDALNPTLVPLHGLPSVTGMVYPQIWIPSDSHSQIMVPTVVLLLLRSHQCCVPQSAVSLVLRGSRLIWTKANALKKPRPK